MKLILVFLVIIVIAEGQRNNQGSQSAYWQAEQPNTRHRRPGPRLDTNRETVKPSDDESHYTKGQWNNHRSQNAYWQAEQPNKKYRRPTGKLDIEPRPTGPPAFTIMPQVQ